ncbi:MAG: hypothetical protein GX608_11530 [Lentisphaerae bacterium]|nr:hypothetical protein [Lentisphaerota bacterium]
MAVEYAGGGGGGVNEGSAGSATHGGGSGGHDTAEPGSGAPNTGGGGGAGGYEGGIVAGNGGSGIVIARYPLATNASPRALQYDADGNLTNDGVSAYAWDGENRLIGMEPVTPTNGSKRVEFAYDYQGRRVSKSVYAWDSESWILTSDSRFLYDGWNLIRDLQPTAPSPQTNFYVWGLDLSGSLQGAGGIGGLLSATFNATNTAFYFCDANGNVTDLVDTNGVSVASYQYDPYGNLIASSGALASVNPIRFSTKYWDIETELGIGEGDIITRKKADGSPVIRWENGAQGIYTVLSTMLP